MTQSCEKWLKYVGKWLNYLTNGLKMWKMTQRFRKWPKYLGNDTWDFYYVGNGLEFDKRFKYVGNDVSIWEMAQVFEKRLQFEMTQICGKAA